MNSPGSGEKAFQEARSSARRIYIGAHCLFKRECLREAWPNIFAHNWPELIQVLDDCSNSRESFDAGKPERISGAISFLGCSARGSSRRIKIRPDNCPKSFRIDCKHCRTIVREVETLFLLESRASRFLSYLSMHGYLKI